MVVSFSFIAWQERSERSFEKVAKAGRRRGIIGAAGLCSGACVETFRLGERRGAGRTRKNLYPCTQTWPEDFVGFWQFILWSGFARHVPLWKLKQIDEHEELASNHSASPDQKETLSYQTWLYRVIRTIWEQIENSVSWNLKDQALLMALTC